MPDNKPKDWSKDLIDWIHSEEGQKALEEANKKSQEAISELRKSYTFTPKEWRKIMDMRFTC